MVMKNIWDLNDENYSGHDIGSFIFWRYFFQSDKNHHYYHYTV